MDKDSSEQPQCSQQLTLDQTVVTTQVIKAEMIHLRQCFQTVTLLLHLAWPEQRPVI